MSRKLYVPVFADLFCKYEEQYLCDFKTCGADAVFLSVGMPLTPSEQEQTLRCVERGVARLKEEGYDSFVWINSFGFGSPLSPEEKAVVEDFARITDLEGKASEGAFCPTDPRFTEFYCDFIRALISVGAKAIVLDDDLCLNIRPGLGCVCDEHLRRIGEVLGRPVTREELKKEVFTGDGGAVRSAWYRVMGDSLREFCGAVRRAADGVDPSVRIGFCSGYTSWDEEGADPVELTRILAGNTKPFLRYTSAPYWEYTNRFPWQPEGHIVEFVRQQMHWCKGISDVDFFTENDTYPRPCGNVPAFAAESFDFMTAASDAPDQLKYLFDYVSSPRYERGYLDAHARNGESVHGVATLLGPLPAAGIYVHETKNKFTEMSFPEEFSDKKQIMRTVSFSAASALLSAASLPVTYEDRGGVTAAFGDAGRTVGLRQKAYILDYPAALELQKRGVDVGLLSAEPFTVGSSEYFAEKDDSVRLSDPARNAAVKAVLAPGAKVESCFAPGVPSSYRYENKDGIRFLVFLFRGDFIDCRKELAASYYRREQIARFCEDVDCPLPAFCGKGAWLYLICKETEDSLGIAFCNYGNDPIAAPLFKTVPVEVETCINCNASATDGGVTLSEIPPRSFGAVLLKKAKR